MDPTWADERIREINEAWETLSDPSRRIAYDRSSTPPTSDRLPVLAVSPAEIDLLDVTPDGVAVFAVNIVQVSGPRYDAAIHEIEVAWGSPWDKSDLQYDAGGSVTLPLTLRFEMDLSNAGFGPDTEYAGDFSVNAVLRS